MLMFRQNQTAKWLKSKDDQEKMFKACIRVGRDQRQLYKQRKNDILVYQQNVIQEKEQALAKKRRQKEERKLALCAKISHTDGFWMSAEDAISNLSKLSNETQKKAALKDQLKFREIILCQEYADRSVFQFSKAKKQFSSQKLLDNLCKLISSAKEPPTRQQIVTNPRLLIGTRIQHRFEEEDGSLTWYEGLVIGHLSDAQTFEVVYFGEDEICEFELLEDYSKNDLKFLTHV